MKIHRSEEGEIAAEVVVELEFENEECDEVSNEEEIGREKVKMAHEAVSLTQKLNLELIIFAKKGWIFCARRV